LPRNKSDDKKSSKLTNPSLYDTGIRSGTRDISRNLTSLYTEL
jgi:hypothetical protein